MAPAHLTQRLVDAVHTTTRTASSLMAEIATMWINDGTADRFIQWHRREGAARQCVAREVLGDFDGSCHPASYHLWLRLPHQWESNLFVAQGLVSGVSVSPGSAFAIDPEQEGAQTVRVSLGSPRSIGALRLGLERIAQTLASRPAELRLVV